MLTTRRVTHQLRALLACFSLVAMLTGSAQAVPIPIYWQNFEGGDGVADLTPGGGNLGIINSTNGGVAFSSTGGIFGGAINATSGQSQQVADPTGIASTTAIGGTAITNLPNQTGNGVGSLNQFSITFWLKHSGAGPTSGSVTPRILTFGDANTFDSSANAVQMHMRNTGFTTGSNNRTMSVPFERPSSNNASNATDADFIGPELLTNEWYFVALTYDGTSTLANNSTVQGAATGSGPEDMNGQYYLGTSNLMDALSRTAIAFTSDTSSPVPGDVSNGAVEFGNAARLYLMNRLADASNSPNTMNRGLNGWIDDIRIYDSVLSSADVNTVRAQGLLGIVPEPSSGTLVTIGVIAIVARKRRTIF